MDVNPLGARWTPHEVSVRPLVANGGLGPQFGSPVTVPAFVLEQQTLVRDATGAEVVSSTQVYVGFDVAAPPGSKVTVWPGTAGTREAVVISASRAAHPTLPAFQTLALT